MALIKSRISESVRQNVRFKKKKKERQQILFPEMDFDFLTRRRAAKLVDTTFEAMKSALEKGEDILISGFGKFKVRFQWARKGINPKTGERIILSSRRIVTFQCSPRLKQKINQHQRP